MLAHEKILFVDDEPNILATFQRNLHKKYVIEVAPGPMEALEMVRTKGPFAMVVSDLKMPVMDGITLLERVRELAPETVRIILSGQGDFDAAIDAVNRGAIFRFLTKPCPPDILLAVLRDAIKQYRLITAEKELLRGTLLGSVKVLVDVLGLVSPEAFGRSERIRTLVGELGKRMKDPNLWQLDVAAMLCQLGCVGLPEELLEKVMRDEQLGAEEQQIFRMHPDIGANLLSNIPRMAPVSELIAHQLDDFSETTPLGARILRVALAFDRLEQQGISAREAVDQLIAGNTAGSYDPAVLAALKAHITEQLGGEIKPTRLEHVEAGMVLAEDLVNAEGTVLLLKGQSISDSALKRLKALPDLLKISGPIPILVALKPDEAPAARPGS
ncbi:response regulator [Desulfovibrio mangrovi]|uniref:HD domain-containing phosphohydrolase n=1 Tax=Desulfovibrio mangrovi TaxID=2976983 RepID=UPI002248339B|nr:HD domain-containing phosphohydrolase [Desulfovibrio mangrovi]UZP66031.1 response regulator [Desulfovibrio mangrovi]